MGANRYGRLIVGLPRSLGADRKILGEADMYALIDFEQERASRGGEPFCVVRFRASQAARTRAEMQRLTRLVGRRARRIDTLGWLQGGLAILLPVTDERGARAFAEDVCVQASLDGGLGYTIHHYSFRDRSDGGAPEDAGRDPPLPPRRSSAPGADGKAGRTEALPVPPEPVWKRSFDLVLGSLLLLAAIPLLASAALWIVVHDPGPVLFRQRRVGYQGRAFTMLKLRTMKMRSDESPHRDHLAGVIKSNGPLVKLDRSGDPRVVPGASLLRTLGIDELPQLLNVMRGDMSLVGPRPCLPYEAAHFAEWHCRRFKVRPGLTGLWQVNGKNLTTFRRMMELDVRYANEATPLSDLVILMRTPLALFHQARG